MPSRLIIREIAETFLIVMLVFLALQITVRTYQVEGYSMAPTMEHTDYVLVNKIVYTKFEKNVINNFLPFVDIQSQEVMFPFHTPQRGEIVIFKYPQDETREFVKRVVGISGMRFGQIHMGHIIQKKKQEKTLIDTVQKNWV